MFQALTRRARKHDRVLANRAETGARRRAPNAMQTGQSGTARAVYHGGVHASPAADHASRMGE